MKIDRKQLISLLAEKSGLDEQKAASQLDSLVERIREAAEEGKSFEVEDFGTFTVEDEELLFDPSETLQTEINQKYEGMKPIELMGAYREAGTPGEFTEGSEQVVEADEPGDDRRDRIKARAEKARKEAEHRARSGEDLPPSDAEAPAAEAETEETVEETGDTAFSQTGDSPLSQKRSREPLSALTSRIISIGAILIVFTAGAWMAWDAGWFGGDADTQQPMLQQPDNRPSMSQEPPPDADSPEDEQAAAEGDAADVSEQSGQETVSGDEEGIGGEDEPAPSVEYGLRGEFNPEPESFYTIVVHSIMERERSDEMAGELREDGYRVVVRTATVDGTEYWRVGIGQFESVSSAQQSAADLPEPYRSEHFIRNFQQ